MALLGKECRLRVPVSLRPPPPAGATAAIFGAGTCLADFQAHGLPAAWVTARNAQPARDLFVAAKLVTTMF